MEQQLTQLIASHCQIIIIRVDDGDAVYREELQRIASQRNAARTNNHSLELNDYSLELPMTAVNKSAMAKVCKIMDDLNSENPRRYLVITFPPSNIETMKPEKPGSITGRLILKRRKAYLETHKNAIVRAIVSQNPEHTMATITMEYTSHIEVIDAYGFINGLTQLLEEPIRQYKKHEKIKALGTTGFDTLCRTKVLLEEILNYAYLPQDMYLKLRDLDGCIYEAILNTLPATK